MDNINNLFGNEELETTETNPITTVVWGIAVVIVALMFLFG